MKRTLKLSMLGFAEPLELRLGELLVALDDDLAGLRVDDVVRARPCRSSSSGSIGRRSSFASFIFLIAARGELGVLLDDDLAADLDVARRALAGEELVLDRSCEYLPPFSMKTVSVE